MCIYRLNHVYHARGLRHICLPLRNDCSWSAVAPHSAHCDIVALLSVVDPPKSSQKYHTIQWNLHISSFQYERNVRIDTITVIEVTPVLDRSYSRTSLYRISYVQYFIHKPLNRLFHIGYVLPPRNVTCNVCYAYALHHLLPGAITEYIFHGYQDNKSSQNIPL